MCASLLLVTSKKLLVLNKRWQESLQVHHVDVVPHITTRCHYSAEPPVLQISLFNSGDLHINSYMVYLLTEIWLSSGSSTHLHTNNTENNTNNNRTTQITNNVEGCVPCHVFASFTLAFTLQLRKKHGKTSVRVRITSVRLTLR